MDTYQTIKKPSEGLYKEKGSKFLAFAYPVNDEAEVKGHVDALKKQYHDARHHCFAFILDDNHWRANDDGEPNHSAGDPILNQIRSFDLQKVLVVVVRYFGGTKLGVSGLINAYKTATHDALGNAETYTATQTSTLTLTYPYEATNTIMKLIDAYHAQIVDQQFEAACQITLAIPQSKIPIFQEMVLESPDITIVH